MRATFIRVRLGSGFWPCWLDLVIGPRSLVIRRSAVWLGIASSYGGRWSKYSHAKRTMSSKSKQLAKNTGMPSVDAAGEAHRKPTFTRGLVCALDDKLGEMVKQQSVES